MEDINTSTAGMHTKSAIMSTILYGVQEILDILHHFDPYVTPLYKYNRLLLLAVILISHSSILVHPRTKTPSPITGSTTL
jgi:hypothetical protein